MTMRVIFLLLVSCSFSSAQQIKSGQEVTIQNDSLVKVIRQFIQIGESMGLRKDESILVLRASDQANPDKAEWFIGATNGASTTEKKFRQFIPSYVSELDGYPIVIYFRQHPDQFFGYSLGYLTYLEKHIYSRFKNKSSYQRITAGGWKVTFVEGKSPIVLGLL